MELNSIEEIVEDIRQGKMVILMDDEDRENEGDLIMAADLVRAERRQGRRRRVEAGARRVEVGQIDRAGRRDHRELRRLTDRVTKPARPHGRGTLGAVQLRWETHHDHAHFVLVDDPLDGVDRMFLAAIDHRVRLRDDTEGVG